MKKKQIALILIPFLIIILCIPISYIIYGYYNPQVDLRITNQKKENQSYPMIHIAYNQKSILGISKKTINKIEKIGNEIRVIEEEIRLNYSCYDVEANYDSKLGIIFLKGYYIDDEGNKNSINESFKTDFKISSFVIK